MIWTGMFVSLSYNTFYWFWLIFPAVKNQNQQWIDPLYKFCPSNQTLHSLFFFSTELHWFSETIKSTTRRQSAAHYNYFKQNAIFRDPKYIIGMLSWLTSPPRNQELCCFWQAMRPLSLLWLLLPTHSSCSTIMPHPHTNRGGSCITPSI